MLNKPKKTRYTFSHNLKTPVSFKVSNKLIKYDRALIATQSGILTASQINSALLTIKRKLKYSKNLIVRVFPQIPVTKRPLEMPLGRGKANISYWATTIKAGSVIFELSTDKTILTDNALKAASLKLPIKTHLVQQSQPR